MKTPLAIMTETTLGGCVTDEELAVADDNSCRSYGVHFGSDNCFNCCLFKSERRWQDDILTSQRNAALIEEGARLTTEGY